LLRFWSCGVGPVEQLVQTEQRRIPIQCMRQHLLHSIPKAECLRWEVLVVGPTIRCRLLGRTRIYLYMYMLGRTNVFIDAMEEFIDGATYTVLW
jgi:hypothetical protein